jgi:2-dehydropantoate 2-reductase
MRFIVYGAGAVGGVVGARLIQHGQEVVLIARGAHLVAMRERRTVELRSPFGHVTLPANAVGHPREVSFRPDDVVLLAMKTQDTAPALDALAAAAGEDIPVACVQNGVENERLAARKFSQVYAVPVRLPATHLEPGVVQSDSATEVSGILDVGRYPEGVDPFAREISAALAASTFSSMPEPRVMRHKYQKLLMNLANVIDAACGLGPETRPLARRAREEAVACYRAAGIDFASDEEDRERRGDLFRIAPVDGKPRGGGSTWQSLARGAGSVEVDYLNGEITLLGRLHGVATPVNDALQRIGNRLARESRPPGSMPIGDLEEFVASVEARSRSATATAR